MVESRAHSTATGRERQNVSKIISRATDQLAIQRAYQLIDRYIKETSEKQQTPFNPAELKWPHPYK